MILRIRFQHALRIALFTAIFGFLFLEIFLLASVRFSATVRLALWSPGDRLNYDHLERVADLQAFFPAMPKPHTLHAGFLLDAHGFRTHTYTSEKSPETFRIVTLGDSFAFSSGGVPYESMWNTLVARRWGEETGQPVELINLGIPAAGTFLEKRIFEIEGSRLSPDLVILALFVGNDFSDEGEEQPLLEQQSYAVRFFRSLPRLPGLLQARAQARKFLDSTGASPASAYSYDGQTPLLPERIFHHIELDRSLFFLPAFRMQAIHHIESVTDALEELSREARKTGAEFIVVVIPDELQVDNALREKLLSYGAWREFPLTELHTEEVQSLIVEALRGKGIATLDLLPALRTAARNGETPYALRNTHWNIRGNAVAAQAIMEFLGQDRFASSEESGPDS